MREYRHILLLVMIMAGVALMVGATAIGVLYQTAMEQQRYRLEETAQSQARFMEAVARFDEQYSTYPGGPREATISQIKDANERFQLKGLGETGEFTLAYRDDDEIVFLLAHKHGATEQPKSVPFASELAEPMRRALSNLSGTVIGPDYDGETVLAAYEPVGGLDLGIVAKIDAREVRAPFLHAGWVVFAVAAVVIAAGTVLFFKASEPMIRRIRESEVRYREMFENMGSGVAVYEAVGAGEDFVFRDFNRAGEKSEHISRGQLLGKRLTEVFPAVREFGLLSVLKRVWTSGQPERLPDRLYRDDRIEGWRENYVYKLPSGEVVTLFEDVSERKRAEQALRESEVRFRGTFENAAVGIAHVGFDGSWLQVNRRLCEIVGYSRDELLRTTFLDITQPDDLDAHFDQFEPLLRGDTGSRSVENRCFHKDGHEVWINLTTALQRDDAGRPLYFIFVIEDISSRKRAEQALKESEIRMRALLDASGDEILLLSRSGQILAINRVAKARLAPSRTDADLVGANLDELLSDAVAEARITTLDHVAETGKRSHIEEELDGRWLESWIYPVIPPEGPVAEVAIYTRDISDRREAEATLRKLYQAIQQSPVSVIITDPMGSIEYVNPKFCAATGYSLAEAIGQNPRILKSGETPPETYTVLWQTITAGQTWTGEFHNRRKNGELFWETASIAPLKDPKGNITHFVAVKEDVTHRKAIEEQLRQAQKMDAVGHLTGGIAHDFNNLLAIIIGNLQLLRERVDGDKKTGALMDDALWSAKRGAELTHRLLAFARRQPLNPDVIDLNSVVGGMIQLLRRTLGAAIDIRELLASDLWKAMADHNELERVVVNLAVNARDAMPNGGVLTLETENVELSQDYGDQFDEILPGEYVLLTVSDTGTGMPAEIVERAFEPFFTTKDVGKGSGLGLSMVYGFAKQSGGHATIYSEVGRGTTVRLYLPRAEDVIMDRAEAKEGAPTDGFKGRVVLVVEDETRLQKVAVAMLKKLGFRVVTADDATAALAYLTTAPPVDVLFTDIELPGGMNGIALAEEVRKESPQTGVVFTSGYSRDAVPGDRRLEPGRIFVPKPYSKDDLARAINAALK